MATLAMAVALASVLGSLHCVGMCGPFALWATRGGSDRVAISAYHLGRLTTFLSAGLAAGVVGSALTLGGDLAGMQSLAAKLAGGLLIFLGLARLLTMIPAWTRRATPATPSWVAALMQRMKPHLADRGPMSQAYLGGLMTTWLPCGWLYLFVLVAAGTGGVVPALVVMFSFWAGTLPALTALTLGARTLIPRFGTYLPLMASVVLIVTGLYTATGRASADLTGLTAPELDAPIHAASFVGASEEPLPCCAP